MIKILSDEIHVWRVNMGSFEAKIDQFMSVINKDEQAKAARFVREVDKNRSVIARSILRQLLGEYLNCTPQAIELQYNAFNKPELAGQDTALLHFNVSHSHDWIIYAVCEKYPVGVDIEYINQDVDVAAIAERFFHPGENQFIQSLTGDAQMAAFFRCWARKEALLKALGQGLSFPLEQCQVSLEEDKPARVLSIVGQNIDHWILHDLAIVDGFAAAVAVNGLVMNIQLRDWS